MIDNTDSGLSPAPVSGNGAQPPTPYIIVRRWAALLLPATIVIIVDQIAKRIVVTSLTPGDLVSPIPALASVFQITHSRNTGAAFGILPQLGDMFLIVALAMIIGVPIFYRRLGAGHWPERIALGMLLGGALGNAFDRLGYGYVVDWVLLRLPGIITNVSNFADHAIVIGIVILFLAAWRSGSASRSEHLPPSES